MSEDKTKVTLSLTKAGALRQLSNLSGESQSAVVDRALDLLLVEVGESSAMPLEELAEQAERVASVVRGEKKKRPMIKGNSVVLEAVREAQDIIETQEAEGE